MEKTLEVLNRLEAAGLIGRYAIGGAIAAAYYVEPTVTYDLDVFTIIPAEFLCAIMLKTGRPKDLIRLTQFLEEAVLQKNIFMGVVDRFSLREEWIQFVLRHFDGQEPAFLIH